MLDATYLAQRRGRTTGEVDGHFRPVNWPVGGQRRIKDSDGFFLLTSFNRTVRDGARLEVPGFAKIPLVGKAFRKSTASTQNRSVMLLARLVLVQRQAPKMGGP